MVPERESESVTERSESESLSAECRMQNAVKSNDSYYKKHSSEFEHEKDIKRIIQKSHRISITA